LAAREVNHMPQVESTRRGQSARPARLDVTSMAFRNGEAIPIRYTADGQNVSPPLAWTEPPRGTLSFAVICDDPDAPSGTFVHWTAWDIPVDQRRLAEAIPRTAETFDIRQGENGFGGTGYGGPKPPPGTPHRYRFRVLALDDRPDLPPGAPAADLQAALAGHVLAEGILVGTYGRDRKRE